jgi:hypothetical protein
VGGVATLAGVPAGAVPVTETLLDATVLLPPTVRQLHATAQQTGAAHKQRSAALDLSKMRRMSPDRLVDVRGQMNPDLRQSILAQMMRGGRLLWEDLFPNTEYQRFGLSDPQVAGVLSLPPGVLTQAQKKKKK